MRRRRPFSRHAGFFASLQGVGPSNHSSLLFSSSPIPRKPPSLLSRRELSSSVCSSPQVEDRLASEQHQEQKKSPPPPTTAMATTRQSEASPFSDTMTASPLLFLDPAAPSSTAADRDSSGPALDFLTAATEQDQRIQQDDDDDHDHDGAGEDIARLMALLGLSPPPLPLGGNSSHDGGGCDCSGAGGFLAKVVGVVGPKCDGEKERLDAWIRHYRRGEGAAGCREPATLAHLLLARASGDTAAVAFPASVKDFLDHDPPRQLTDNPE